MSEIINTKLKLKGSKSGFEGYGRLVLTDKAIIPGKEYDVEIKVCEHEGKKGGT